MQIRSDIAVIGGGPSGLYAAALLAREGLDVRLLERKGEIGADVVCTGIVGKEIFPEFGLPTDSVLREVQEVRLVSSNGSEILYRHPEPFACVVDRAAFDRSLAETARQAGAGIDLGASARRVGWTPDGVRIDAVGPGGEPRRYEARMAILATGIDSRLNAQAGLGSAKDHLYGAQAEIPTSDETVAIFVGRNVAPGAFAWAVPASGGLTRVGLVTSRRPRAWLVDFIRRNYPGLNRSFRPADVKVKAIAQGLVHRTAGDRVIALGEAAGQVKTTTGGGISFGLFSARIAARVVSAAGRAGSFAARRLSGYDEAWRAELKREILVGHFARRIFAGFTDHQIEHLFDLARTDGIIPLMQNEGRFDWQSGLIIGLAQRVPPFSYFGAIRRKLNLLEHLQN